MAEGINVSTVRQLIRASSLNSSSTGIKTLKEVIDSYAKRVVDAAKIIAESKKMKTIMGEHVTEAVQSLQTTEETTEN
jgi:histone H3/H4